MPFKEPFTNFVSKDLELPISCYFRLLCSMLSDSRLVNIFSSQAKEIELIVKSPSH